MTTAGQSPAPSAGTGLATMPGHLLRRAQQRHTAIWLDEVGPAPTGPQYAVLGAVVAWPGSDQRRVGTAASLDRSTTADVVDRLAARGWLTRARDTADARRDVLDPTAAGRAALDGLGPVVAAVQDRLVAGLSAVDAGALAEDLVAVAGLDPAARAALPEPLRIPGHLLRCAQQRHTRLFTEVVGAEVTGPQYAAVRAVADEPGLSQRRLGELTGLDRSTTADVVARLVDRGLVDRHRDPADGRRRVLALSDRAEVALAPLTARAEEVQALLLARLADERRAGFLERLRVVAALPG